MLTEKPAEAVPPSEPEQPALLQVRHLSFAYPGSTSLFAGLSLDVAAGVTRVEGEVGKSTLLRLLAGELRGSGQITLAGQRLDADAVLWRDRVCWIDPRDAALDALTPAQLWTERQVRQAPGDDAAWQRHVAGFSLTPHLHKPMYMLSTGSRRKAVLAVALSAGAALTLLDEPTSGLDRPSLAWLAVSLTALHGQSGQVCLLASAYGLEDALPMAATLTI